MRASCDILLIGGGVVGASIAYHLARRRVGRIVLLEKGFLGAGASGKTAAIVRRLDDSVPTAALARHSQQIYEHFPETIGGPSVYSRTGLVLILPEGTERSTLPFPGSGPGLRPLSGLELMEIDPNAHLAEGESASFDAEAGTVDPVQVLASLAEAARRAGADLRQGVEVRSLILEKGKVTGVETNEGPYACGALVLAAGSWTASLARGVKVAVPIQPCRGQVALFRRPLDCGRRPVVYLDGNQGLYFKPASGELIEAGGLGGLEREADVDPDHYNEAADGEWLRQVRQRLGRRFPAMHRGYGRGGFGALVAVTPDGCPILDRLPGVDGVWCAAGFNGQDVALAPGAGRLLCELLLAGKADGLEATSFRLGRFTEEESVRNPPAPAAAS